MALPAYQDVGTVAASGTTISPAWPTHQAGDLALLICEGSSIPNLTVANGFAEIENSPVNESTPAVTILSVYWCVATSSSMAAPTLTTSNHIVGVIVTFRGGVWVGNPWEVTASAIETTNSTVLTCPSVTTTLNDCLIVLCGSRSNDSAAEHFSNFANVNLANIAERVDAGTLTSNGGGFVMATGEFATAGVTGTTTADIANGTTTAALTIALKPDDGVRPAAVSSSSVNIQNIETTLRDRASTAQQISGDQRGQERPRTFYG